MIGIASTGSGKTLAFLAPLFERIAADAAGLILPVMTAVRGRRDGTDRTE